MLYFQQWWELERAKMKGIEENKQIKLTDNNKYIKVNVIPTLVPILTVYILTHNTWKIMITLVFVCFRILYAEKVKQLIVLCKPETEGYNN